MPLTGDVLSNRAALLSGVENMLPGFTAFGLFGVAQISTAAAAAFALTDIAGNSLVVPASSTDPAYIAYCSFNLPTGLVADAANRVLKLSSAATVPSAANSCSSSVSGSSPFAYAAESVRSPSVPGTWVALTANTTFNLYSTDGANAAAGTVAAAAGTVFVDAEIIFLKRKVAIKAQDGMRSKSQAYIAAGVAAGVI